MSVEGHDHMTPGSVVKRLTLSLHTSSALSIFPCASECSNKYCVQNIKFIVSFDFILGFAHRKFLKIYYREIAQKKKEFGKFVQIRQKLFPSLRLQQEKVM